MGLFSKLFGGSGSTTTTNVTRVATEYEQINQNARYSVARTVKAEIEESTDPEICDAYIHSVANRTLQYMTRYETNGKYTAEMLDIIMDEIERQCAELNRNCPAWAGRVEQSRYPTCDWFFGYGLYTKVTE